MKVKWNGLKWRILFSLACVLVFSGLSGKAEAATGAEVFNLTTDRAAGRCDFTISGLTVTDTVRPVVSVEIVNKTKGTVVSTIPYEAQGDTVGGKITLQELNYDYSVYSITAKVDGQIIGETQECDFSIHTNKLDFSVTGDVSDAERAFNLNSTEASGGVLVPGEGNNVSVYVWKSDEATAEQVGDTKILAGDSIQWGDVNIASTSETGYGTWNAKAVLTNGSWGTVASFITLKETTYTIEPKASLSTVKSTSLEKKQSFRVQLKSLQNVYGVKKVTFEIYNSDDEKLAAKGVSTEDTEDDENYIAEITYKSVDYTLEKLSVRAVITDLKGNKRTYSKASSVDLNVKSGKTKVKKNKKDSSCDFTLTGAYVPGNIKNVQFVVYQKKGSKKVKQKAYDATVSASSKKYAVNISVDTAGKYVLNTYAYTAWGKKILLSETDYTIEKEDLGKQGWIFEKVNGVKYKFYYVNNEKITDLTKILNLKKNGNNKISIEVNRAAGVVTFYLYDEETGKYDIPIKSAAVSVGRDVGTVAGAGSLNIQSSFTPIGNYSVCSNGAAVRYSLKPMHEPDGSTVYARWCTHIVGNVYFHAIAVHSQSHYALSTRSYNRLGTPASAGCIRMTVADAKWLYTYVPTGTSVKISVGSSSKPGPYGKPATIKISGVSYDPTDPDVPDSRKIADYKAKRISGYMTKDGVKVGY